MSASDPWVSLRNGDIEKGLREFKRSYDREPSTSHTMELGSAYLWLQRYEKAWALFREAIARYPKSMSSFYGMGGTAKWCMGDSSDAIRQWCDGLDAQYADTNGLAIHLPLLLFTASVLSPSSFKVEAAIGLIKAKVKDPRINEWPGPVGLRVLRELDGPVFRKLCSSADELESTDRNWLASFYEGVLAYQINHNEIAFRTAMRKLADTCSSEWNSQEFFLARMWSEEFFIARLAAK